MALCRTVFNNTTSDPKCLSEVFIKCGGSPRRCFSSKGTVAAASKANNPAEDLANRTAVLAACCHKYWGVGLENSRLEKTGSVVVPEFRAFKEKTIHLEHDPDLAVVADDVILASPSLGMDSWVYVPRPAEASETSGSEVTYRYLELPQEFGPSSRRPYKNHDQKGM